MGFAAAGDGRRRCDRPRRRPAPPPAPAPPRSDRWLDDFLIKLRPKLATTSAQGLTTIASSLPAISSGVRLNDVVQEAQARYAQLTAEEEAAAAAGGDWDAAAVAEGGEGGYAPAVQEPVAV